MITVEDLVIKLATATHISIQTFDYRLVQSFTNQIWRGEGLTEKQASLSLKIIKKYYKILTADTGVNILEFVDNPVYKNPFRQPRNIKRISISNHKDERFAAKCIKVEFPYNDEYINHIRQGKPKLGTAFWNKEERAWFFDLCEANIKFLSEWITKENFQCDEEFSHYLKQQEKIINDMDQYITVLTIDNGIPAYKNPNNFLPTLKSQEILPAIFEARQNGVNIWCETIGKFLENHPNQILSQFLLNDIAEPYHIDSTKNSITVLTEIVRYLRPCVFVIPGGSELEKLTEAYKFLKSMEISQEKMSVMFRLPSEKGKIFNDYVKSEKLNNPVDENTEVVFVSGKIPKPLIKSSIYFNSIINMGFDNAHYTSRHFIDNHQNLVYFSERPKQNRFLWDFNDLRI